MDYTAIERKLFFFCFVIIFYDILRYTVPKTRRAVLLDIWFDLMSLVTSYLVQGFQDGQSLSPPKCFEGFFKKKLFYHVGGRVKSKTLMLSTDLNNSSCHHWKTVDRKADGHFEWKPFVSSNQERFIKCRSSTTVNTWENVKKISKLPEWNAFVEVNYSCLVTMLKQ